MHPLFEKTSVRSFYGRHTRLRKLPGKPELRGLCPLHDGKSPSFFVHLEAGSFKCFGCGAQGGPVEFESARLGVSSEEAAAQLASEYRLGPSPNGTRPEVLPAGLNPPPNGKPPRPCGSAPPPKLPAANRELRTGIYRFLLEAGRPLDDRALEYFAQLSIRPEALEQFQVAYLRDSYATAAELRRLFEAETLLAAGVFHKDAAGQMRFQFQHHPLLIPVLQQGQPVYLQGHRLDRREPGQVQLAQVTVPTIFNIDVLDGLPASSPAYFCQDAFTAMLLNQEGFPALGLVGGGIRYEWVEALSVYTVHLVVRSKRIQQEVVRAFHWQNVPVHVVELSPGLIGAADLKARLSRARLEAPDFRLIVKALRRRVEDPGQAYGYLELAKAIFKRFQSSGGVFHVDDQDRCRLCYGQSVYRVGDHPDFNALMQAETGFIHTEPEARILWAALSNLCRLQGEREGTSRQAAKPQ